MRIAHFSDLHVLSLEGVSLHRYFGKRLTGLVNLKLRRAHVHHESYVREIAKEVSRVAPDHVVVTGDITNLALETEYALASEILDEMLHLSPHDVSLVPGNHDIYTQGALEKRRFEGYFARYMHSDLDVGVDIGTGHFPYVKLRGKAAIIGLSSAVPRPPLVASGLLGRRQLDALERALAHEEVKARTPVILVHHPLFNPPSSLKARLSGLTDASELLRIVKTLSRGLVLHGHLHRRIACEVTTESGTVTVVGATSASLHDERKTRMSGFNVYEIDDLGSLVRVEAHVLDPSTGLFRVEDILAA